MRNARAERQGIVSAKASWRRLWGGAAPAALITASLCLAGCHSYGSDDITGSITPTSVPPTSAAQLQRYTAELGQRYDQRPDDKRIAMSYARALRASGRYDQAVAVAQRLAAKYPKDMQVLGAYGKALVEDGRLREAEQVLPQAHTPEQPNWSILSAQGTVEDQMGDHAQAQSYYNAALKIAPNQPAVLSNLGLSYALSKQLPLAENTLRLAASQPGADMRVRQNLALVLALEGKFDAAQTVAQQDLSPVDAAEDVASIKQMIAQSDTWNRIRALDKPSQTASSRPHKIRQLAKLNKVQPQAGQVTQVGAAD